MKGRLVRAFVEGEEERERRTAAWVHERSSVAAGHGQAHGVMGAGGGEENGWSGGGRIRGI